MKKIILHIFTVTVMLFGISGSVFAQSSVTGIVKSGPDGTPVSGVTVTIQETSTSTATNSSGEYTLGVATGTVRTLIIGGTRRTFYVNSGVNQMNVWIDAVSDADANNYSAVEIGSQIWIGENLKVTHYRSGKAIPEVTSGPEWSALNGGAYCYYENDVNNGPIYGLLYNVYTILDHGGLCPTGWHVPTPEEWVILADNLGGLSVAGGKLKEAGLANWSDPNTGATNETGFTGRPGGRRDGPSGDFTSIHDRIYYWSRKEFPPYQETSSLPRTLRNSDSYLGAPDYSITDAHYVRCLKGEVFPTASTATPSAITIDGAQVGYSISSDGGYSVTERGVCLSTSVNPTIDDFHTNDGTGTGTFTSSVIGLTPNTTYYARAYATNIMGTAYGNEISFTTTSIPAIVTNTDDNGIGSLRYVILYTNSTIGIKETITFNIPGAGPFTIKPLTQLPVITDPVIIDGYSQPGASVATASDPATIMIEILGEMSGAPDSGLVVRAGNCNISGLSIRNFQRNLILYGDGNNTIRGNFITSGYAGILIYSPDNQIGGVSPAERNVISQVDGDGIRIENTAGGQAARNRITGNYIGVDKTGELDQGNDFSGIAIIDSPDNIIGGTTGQERNLISGNVVGISIRNNNATGNKISGNFIGTNAGGIKGVGNDNGITIDAPSNFIGGSAEGSGNVISGNHIIGITLNENAVGNIIQGNLIGTDRTGSVSLKNSISGIYITGGKNNQIGGVEPGSANIISGNAENGIFFSGKNVGPVTVTAEGNRILGNYIGTDITGKEALGNGTDGIWFYNNAYNNIIGGSEPGSGNIIAFNKRAGVHVGGTTGPGTGNAILSNSIHSNGSIGIDLGGNGVTPNDAGDPDTGPDNLQNFPVPETISFSTGTVTIAGSLNSEASKTCTIQFFVSKAANPTDYGEGQNYLGSQSVTTGADGNALFTATFPVKSSWGTVITLTATDQAGNSSEFSKAMGGLQDQVVAPGSWPLRFTISQNGVPNITDGSDLDAVRASFQTWAAIPEADITFTDNGTTSSRYANATDGINLVSFEDDQFPFSYGVLAVAAKTLKIDQTTLEAQIIDADIVVNPDFVNDIEYNLGAGYDNINAGYFDIQSVVTHEIGHILGLLHTGVVNSTMFFTLGPGIQVRSLEQDDKSWAGYRYPRQPEYNAAYGSVSGNITYGYGGQPVAGALVYAINSTANDSVHAYSDAKGDYLVPGLIPGSYNIYIEPLDGDVNGYALRPGNISSYIYCNTVYTDYPGEFYSGSAESSDETNDTRTAVNVSAGVTAQGINLITNKDITPPSVVKVRPTNLSGNLISILSNFSIRFSEPVDEASLTDASCYLTAGTKSFGGSYTTLGDSANVVIFDPESVLQHGTEYTLHIKDGVKDLKGNPLQPEFTATFTTIAEDNVSPEVTEVIPANGTGSVFVTDKIRVFFSEPMNRSSVEEGFSLGYTDPDVQKTVAGSFSWDNENVSVTYSPLGGLQEGTGYTLRLAGSIADLSGNNLTASELSFTTVLQAPPEIIYYGPGNGSTEIPVTTPVAVDFSEPINKYTVNSATFRLLPGNNPTSGTTPVQGTFEFLNDNSRVIFRPDADLAFNQTYTIELTDGIGDVSTTAMTFAGLTATFTTAAKPSVPHIVYLAPASGIPGSVVTIAGTGFDPDPARNAIAFNGLAAPVKEATLTSLTTEVPLAALSGMVSVTVNGIASDNMMYFYIIPRSLDPCSDVIANTSTGTKSTHGVDVTPDGAFAYITNPDEGTVTALSLTNLQSASITVGNTPVKIDINPRGTRAYVTNFNSHSVSVIDLAVNSPTRNQVIETIAVGIEPYGLAVTPDGKRVYVANSYSGTLSLIDVDPNSGGFDHVVANVSTGTKSGGVAVTPDAGMVLVTGDFGLKIINSNPADKDYNSVIANVSSGTKTKEVAVTPDAGLAIVSTAEGHLLVINLHPENGDYSDAVIANVSTGTKVSDVKVSGDGLFVYVTDTDNDQILVYKIGVGGTGTTSGSAVSGLTLIPHETIPVGSSPEGLVINDDATRLYVIDTETSTGNREVTTVAICCGPISPAKAIGDLIITLQNLINNGTISEAKGNELIKKLNDALSNLYRDKTKTEVNNLGAIANQISGLIKSGKLPSVQGKALINSINAVIIQLNGAKSASDGTFLTGNEKSIQDFISASGLGVIYPNPFSESITINFEIADNDEGLNKVLLKVYDMEGRLVSTLIDQLMQMGRYTIIWDGKNGQGGRVPYGTYFVLFRTGSVEETGKIMLIRPY